MKRSHFIYARGLAILLVTFVLISVPVWAQQIALRSVKPNQGRPGEEVNLAIQGGGFCGPATVRIGEFEAGDVRVDSDSAISARVFIPEGADPGSRDVEVTVDCGGPEETFSAVLPGGFTVLESPGGSTPEPRPGPGPEPTPSPEPFDNWLLIIVIVVVVGVIVVGGGLLTVTLAVRARRAMVKKQTQMQQEMQQTQQELEQLQEQAEEGELPDTCQSGKIKVIRDKPELKPGLWKVTGLRVTLYDEAQAQQGSSQRVEEHDVPEELVKRVDKAARNKLLWGDSEKLAAEIVEIGRALTAQVIAWQTRSGGGRDVRVEPEITGGEGSVNFTLYRCVGPPTWWQKVKSWEVKAQAVRHFPQEFRGPSTGEAEEAYRAMLEKGITIYVRNLVREASRLWDTEGIGISVEVSLK